MESIKHLIVEFLQAAVWGTPAGFFWSVVLNKSPLQGVVVAIIIISVVFVWRLRRIRCCGCGKILNLYIVLWDDKLTLNERLNFESYEDSSKLFRCRQCHRLQCLPCATKENFRCRICQEQSLQTGYFAS